MDELAHDLASALDETSEQARLDEEAWEGSALSPQQQQRRQARKRRGRKRRSLCSHALEHSRCFSEASESSQEEGGASESDPDRAVVKRLCSLNVTLKKHHAWHESDSFTETAPAQPLRRRRRVKRSGCVAAGDVSATLQKKLKVSEARPPPHVPTCPLRGGCQHKKQRLSHWGSGGAWRGAQGGHKEGGHCDPEEHKASDENMTDSEASSVCSSDGLFTNDEGRQGDDEQSDWFYEGECDQGFRVPNLRLHRESSPVIPVTEVGPTVTTYPSPPFLLPSRPAQRGYHARLNRFPGIAARCIRKGRRRLVGKEGPVGAVPSDRVDHFGQDPFQRELRRNVCMRGPYREWSVLSRLQPLPLGFNPLMPLYPLDVLTDGAHRRGNPQHSRSRQTSVHLGSLCTSGVKRRRKTSTMSNPGTAASSHIAETEGHSPDCAANKTSSCMEWAEGENRAGSGAESPGPGQPVSAVMSLPHVAGTQL
ncbi:G patch domain-containing protein 2-like [Narcine bancroftii]|uniref:G patch domain-containing protein 2-like n=1 Tax=Narcine bancroftii TaxID=1343680 RepID=UPI00383146EC